MQPSFLKLVVVGLVLHPFAIFGSVIERSITITSSPSKAWVCVKKKGAFQCIGTTMDPLRMRFFSDSEAKYIYIKQLGYDTKRLKVTPETQNSDVTLMKSSFLSLSHNEMNTQPEELRELLNSVSDYIYVKNNNITKHPGVSFAAPIGLVENDGKTYAYVTLNLGLEYQRRKLKPLYRERKKEEFYQKLSSTLLTDVAEDFLTAFADIKKRYKLNINGLSLQIQYPKLKVKLYDDERIETRVSTQMWETQKHKYTQTTIWDETVSELKASNQHIYSTYLALIPFSRMPNPDAKKNGFSLIQPLVVMSNDNRKGKLEKVSFSNAGQK